MTRDFNQQVIEEFRANRGRVGGMFEGARLILLTTTGARSGVPHTVPLGYLPDGVARIIVIASAGGAPRHPAWYHNLVADPKVTVESGPFTMVAEATVLTGPERDEIFARAVEADPGWADYEARSSRTLPVVALELKDGGPPQGGSLGDALRLIHESFRHELGIIRKEFAAGAGLGAQLRINCLTACAGLHGHHEKEDMGLFPALGEQFPELAQVLDRLRAEHQTISALVDDLQRVVRDGTGGLAEVDRLIAELEAHLDYEEEQLIPLLS